MPLALPVRLNGTGIGVLHITSGARRRIPNPLAAMLGPQSTIMFWSIEFHVARRDGQ